MKKSRKAIAITVIISICVTVCLGFLGFKLYNHEIGTAGDHCLYAVSEPCGAADAGVFLYSE